MCWKSSHVELNSRTGWAPAAVTNQICLHARRFSCASIQFTNGNICQPAAAPADGTWPVQPTWRQTCSSYHWNTPCLQEHKQLPFWGPAYTAHLEVDYKAKINAGSTILCTCSVESMEGRKVWMQATISDGPTGALQAAPYACVYLAGLCWPRWAALIFDSSAG